MDLHVLVRAGAGVAEDGRVHGDLAARLAVASGDEEKEKTVVSKGGEGRMERYIMLI